MGCKSIGGAILTVDAALAGSSRLVILGPTASGKSSLAMAMARELGAEILSVDSMQVYRGMDIGTAKPTVADRALVPHHGIDLAAANESFTVAKFVEMAEQTITDTDRRNVGLILTGGTPLYYKALFEGLFEGPPADPELRERLYAMSADLLHQKLAEVDPISATRLHRNDTRRIVRALEVYELTAKPISAWQTDWPAGKHKHTARWFGLAWEKDAINRRINGRVKQMIEAGWLEETARLLDAGGFSPTSGEATGYRMLASHLAGQISLTDAIEQIKITSRQLARRQMKWFRRFPNVTWLDGSQPIEQLRDKVLRGGL